LCDVCSSALSVDSSTAGSAEKVKPIELVYDTEATFGPSYSECAKNPALNSVSNCEKNIKISENSKTINVFILLKKFQKKMQSTFFLASSLTAPRDR